ncbi:MAG: hypothetical protein ACYS32_01850 [Planctomycetota bacterium]
MFILVRPVGKLQKPVLIFVPLTRLTRCMYAVIVALLPATLGTYARQW